MIPKIQAEFCITGLKISYEEITDLLGISPTRVWHMGESIQGTLLTREHNGWCLSSGYERELDITKPIKNLLQILLPKSDIINRICSQSGLDAEISCVIYIVDETPIITLDQDIISKLVDLNATVDIDIILVK